MPSSGLIRRVSDPTVVDQGSEVAPIGSNQRYCVQLPASFNSAYGNQSITASTTAFTVVPFRLRRPLIVDAATVDVTSAAAGSSLTVAVYSLDAVNARGRVQWVSTFATTSTGEQTAQTFGVLPAGLLGLAYQASGGNPTMRATSAIWSDVANVWHVNGGQFGPSKNFEIAQCFEVSGVIGRPFQRVDIGNQLGQFPTPSVWFRIRL